MNQLPGPNELPGPGNIKPIISDKHVGEAQLAAEQMSCKETPLNMGQGVAISLAECALIRIQKSSTRQ